MPQIQGGFGVISEHRQMRLGFGGQGDDIGDRQEGSGGGFPDPGLLAQLGFGDLHDQMRRQAAMRLPQHPTIQGGAQDRLQRIMVALLRAAIITFGGLGHLLFVDPVDRSYQRDFIGRVVHALRGPGRQHHVISIRLGLASSHVATRSKEHGPGDGIEMPGDLRHQLRVLRGEANPAPAGAVAVLGQRCVVLQCGSRGQGAFEALGRRLAHPQAAWGGVATGLG